MLLIIYCYKYYNVEMKSIGQGYEKRATSGRAWNYIYWVRDYSSYGGVLLVIGVASSPGRA